MNLRLMTMAGAVAAAMLGQAHAASTDTVTTGLLTGNGGGDLVLAFLGANGASILWDLSDGANDLTVNDIKTAIPFSITNSAVSAFVKATGGAGQWQVFGFANQGQINGDALFNPDVATNSGIAMTVNGAPVLGITGSGLEAAALSVGGWVERNNAAGLPDNGALEAATSLLPHHFTAPNADHGLTIAGENATANLNQLLDFYFIQKDPNQPIEPSILGSFTGPGSNNVAPIATLLGQFSFDYDATSEVATLSFAEPAPVPVPPAVWLMGSAIAGLAGVQRRRQRA